jgi:membrane protein implicated in regulation of membrane protease activity
MTSSYLIVWVVIGIIALTIDLITSTFLFVWFTIGSIAAIIAQALGYSLSIQIISFTSVSGLFMAVGYPLVKRTIKKTVKRTQTMEESYVGRTFAVDDDVIEKAMIKFDGIYWTVKNKGRQINKGDVVEVMGIEGNKLIIKKI